MTYRDQLIGLSQECQRQVLAVYALYVEGDIDAEDAEATIAGIIAAHNSKATALADLSIAATIMLALGGEIATLGLVPAANDVDRLRKAARTVFTVADKSPVPEAIVGRLARSEPLETASRAYSEGMTTSPRITGWVRNVTEGSCELCEWWGRDGRVWPPDHPFARHKGCTCTPEPVVVTEIRSTEYTRRLSNAE